MDDQDERSYRTLFAIPDLPQVVVSTQLARFAQSMVGVALVLFHAGRVPLAAAPLSAQASERTLGL